VKPSLKLPPGTSVVAAGLVISGLTAYGYLLVTARAVGPRAYAGLSAQWAFLLLVGPGVFATLEQEIGRAVAARRAVGKGSRPVVARSAIVGMAMLAVLVVAVLAGAHFITLRLFDGNQLLLVGTLIGLAGYYVQFIVRGVLAGSGLFQQYSAIVAVEGILRFLPCLVLAILAVRGAGAYGLVFGFAPLTALIVLAWRDRPRLEPGPPAAWSELSTAIGYLLVGSLLAQALINTAPIAVKLLATKSQEAEAGTFLAGMVIARVPLFLFGAIQASLLPNLSRQIASGHWEEFRRGLRHLVGLVAAVGVVCAVGAAVLGPTFFPILFGKRFSLGHLDFAYLGGASAAYMVAMLLAQALIALRRYRTMALSWALGMAGLLAMLAVHGELLIRVERSFLAGTLLAMAGMAAGTVAAVRAGPPTGLSRPEQTELTLPQEP
jgi:O-antigen/teichoic acid export membrane protein